MATTTPLNGEGLPMGAPTIAQIDTIPTRLAVAKGIAQGTENAAISQITSALLPAEEAASLSSDMIQQAIDDALAPAELVAAQTAQVMLDAISAILLPLSADIAANTSKKKRSCTGGSSTAGATAPGLSPPPPPPPLGCFWLLAPPGSGQADQLLCVSPTPGQPSGAPTPNVVAAGPPAGQTAVTGGGLVIYAVWVNCITRQLAGVVNLTGTIARQLRTEGWLPVFPPGTIEARTPQEAAQALTALAATIGPMCPA